MKTRPLGKSGLDVSEICLGTASFGSTIEKQTSFDVMDFYFESGGKFIDTADIYDNWTPGFHGGTAETVIGQWFAEKKNRKEIILTTKVRGRMWEGEDGEGLSRKHIMRACEDSLKRLKTDYVDLYLSHYPDENTPIEETLSAMDDLRKQGKVRNIGWSNLYGSSLTGALEKSKSAKLEAPVCIQPYFNLVDRRLFERNALPQAQKEGLGVTPYTPLVGGLLAGRYRNESSEKGNRIKELPDKLTDQNFKIVDVLEEISKKYEKSIAQIALGWLLSHDWITAPIIGASRVEQVKDNLGAAGFRLETEDKEKIDSLTAWE